MLGSPILYLKGMRAIMFQLSGFYYSFHVCLVLLLFGRGHAWVRPDLGRVSVARALFSRRY